MAGDLVKEVLETTNSANLFDTFKKLGVDPREGEKVLRHESFRNIFPTREPGLLKFKAPSLLTAGKLSRAADDYADFLKKRSVRNKVLIGATLAALGAGGAYALLSDKPEEGRPKPLERHFSNLPIFKNKE